LGGSALIHLDSPGPGHLGAFPLRKSARSVAASGGGSFFGRGRVRMCFHVKKFS
jgi:hypothetical protein